MTEVKVCMTGVRILNYNDPFAGVPYRKQGGVIGKGAKQDFSNEGQQHCSLPGTD